MRLDREMERSIAAHMSYLRDLGVSSLNRRPQSPLSGAVEWETLKDEDPGDWDAAVEPPSVPAAPGAATQQIAAPRATIPAKIELDGLKESTIPRVPFPAQPPIGSRVVPGKRLEALQAVRERIGECTRCALAAGRNKIVFGDGDANAKLMFVGEGPGADEDAQGLPFVGRAGQLLNNMIAAMGLKREQVYIANIVKCRPPQNRVPEPEEAHCCSAFLFEQIDVIRPEVLVALGSTAATYLLGAKSSLSALRGRVHSWRGAKLVVTYHPAFLLRDPRQKKEAWLDLQLAMEQLGMQPPSR